MDWRILRFEQLDSTQRWLCRQAQAEQEGLCVVAGTQTEGVGRQQRNWHSELGGLYLSFLLKPKRLLPELPWALSWAVWSALEACSGLELTLKAPNDLLLQGRKLAGTLIDSRILGRIPLYYVCGLGVNLNQTEFPPSLRAADGAGATSLRQVTGKCVDSERFVTALLGQFAGCYEKLCGDGFEHSLLLALGGRRVQIGYNGQAFISFEEYWHGRNGLG